MKPARRYSAVLAEDESVLRDELRQALTALWPELHVAGEARDGIEALQMLEKQAPDVLFLDMQMPGLGGLDVARHAQGRCRVVFVTAYDAYAVAAFETGALDYVLKPIDPARLARTVERLKRELHGDAAPPGLDPLLQRPLSGGESRSYLKWINASSGQTLRVITTDEVEYFQADTKYTRVVTADGEYLVRMSLRQLLDQLDPERFWQVHRSTIVNAGAIAMVTRDFRGHVHLSLKNRPERLPVSEAYHPLFRQM